MFHYRDSGVVFVLDDMAGNVMRIGVVDSSFLHPRSANVFMDVLSGHEVLPVLLRPIAGILETATEKVRIEVDAL